MLSSAQRDEFDRRGLLRLPATIPPAKVTAMRQRLWQHLLDTHAIHPDRPETWTVQTPAQFQKLTGTGAFDVQGSITMSGTIPVGQTVTLMGAAFLGADKVETLREGIALAEQSIDTGSAQGALDGLVAASNA